MKYIKKALTALVTLSVLSTASFAEDREFKVLPVFTDANWCGQTEVAVVVGSSNFDKDELSTGANYGLEISFDCPVFTLPGDHIKKNLSNIHPV